MIGITVLAIFSFIVCVSGTIFALKVLKNKKKDNKNVSN